MKPNILLTGGSGQLGGELLPRLQQLARIVAPNRSEMDLRKPSDIRRMISEVRPQVIVNAAAYTAVDQAETDEPAARAINVDAPEVLAETATKIGAAVIHFSTDYVFDGSKRAPYKESDAPSPLNAYGRTKLAGEEAIRASGVPHLIFRTSWLYATRGKNFVLTILRLATERQELRIVFDQTGAPTCSADLAVAIQKILSKFLSEQTKSDVFRRVAGTYHATAGGATSWHEFAKTILEQAKRDSSIGWVQAVTKSRAFCATQVTPISSAQFGAPARRPP
jgi:dTDP-4-dehydrorhamnose reductase